MLLGAQPGKGRVGHGGEVGKAVCAEVDEGSIGDGLGPGRLGPAKGAGPGARSRKDALWCGTKNMTYPPSGKGLHCIQTTSPSYQGKPRQHFWEERGTVSLLSRASLNLSPPAGCGQAEGAHFPVWPALAPLCSGLGPRQREGRHVLPIALGLSQSLLMPFSRTPMGGHCGGGGSVARLAGDPDAQAGFGLDGSEMLWLELEEKWTGTASGPFLQSVP